MWPKLKTAWLVPAGPALVMLLSSPAAARPQDDVMSGAFHCAAISESRRWLDCYYGAAQPLRAALGLPPAPAAQVSLVSAPPGNQPPSDAAVRDVVISGAFRCRGLADGHQWLNCYYAAAQPMRATLGLPPAPQLKGVPQAALGAGALVAAQAQPFIPRPQLSADHISARMTSYTFDKFGFFTAMLANGQTWRQVSGDTTFAHWKKPAASYLVRITHGFLGSYNFQVQGLPGLFKVLPPQ